jgi:hypothetical protein
MNARIVKAKMQKFLFVESLKNLYVVIKANDPTNEIDAIEEILISFATAPHMQIDINATIGEKTRNKPAATATPFPPLKRSHMGWTCPIKQHKHGTKLINPSIPNFRV